MKHTVSLLTVIIGANLSFAQESIVELDPVYSLSIPIVESSTIESTGRSDWISGDILQAIQANDLTSALRRVPGLTISRYNPVGAYGGSDGGGIFIRGHGSGRPGADIATMIDGVPLFVGVWTHPLIDTLSIDMADSIEVIKSPQPVRRGNMSFGAINIRPKTALVQGHHGGLETSYGHFDTSMVKGLYAFQQDKLGVLLSGSNRQSDGHRDNADGEVQAFYGNLNYAISDNWTFSALASITDSTANDPEPIGTALPITENYQTKNRFYLGKIQYQSSQIVFDLKLHVEDGTGDWLQWHAAPPPPFPSQSLQSTTDYLNYGMKSTLRGQAGSIDWSVGFDWDRFGGGLTETYSISPTNKFEEVYFELASPFAFVSHTIELQNNHSLELSGGVRFQKHSEFEDHYSGQVGMIYKTSHTQSYLQFSQSANYPGVYVSVFGRRPPPWQVKENWRDLDVETVQHIELGTQIHLNNAWTVDCSIFQDEVKDAIRLVTPPPSGYITNIGSYQTQGMEVMIRFQQPHWSLFSGLTWMDSDSSTVPNLPKFMGTIGFHAQRGPWMFAADFQRISSQYVSNPRFGTALQSVDAYQMLSAKIAYTTEGSLNWEYYLSGENLLNQPYEYRPGYPMPGISLTLGAKLSW